MEFKIIIAGGRDFDDYEKLKKEVDYFIHQNNRHFIKKPVIISGGAIGADNLGERYAKEREFELIVEDASWDSYGSYAGHLRNTQMARKADACILFWDGLSRGTRDMMYTANQFGLITKVVYYNKKGWSNE